MRTLTSLITVLTLSFSTTALVGCATSGDEITSADDADATGVGKFDMWQAADGWHFHLKSGNGRILLTSEAYSARTGAINGILSVLDNGVDAHQFTVVQAANGGYFLHLGAANNEIISFSQVYSTKSNATRAITSCVKAVTSYLDTMEANTSGARVRVEQGATNQFRFNVYAQNGEIVLTSESYTTAAAAWNGAYAVQDAAASSASFSLLTSADGRYYFTVTALNGQVVGLSQMYTTKQAAQSGIASVQGVIEGMTIL